VLQKFSEDDNYPPKCFNNGVYQIEMPCPLNAHNFSARTSPLFAGILTSAVPASNAHRRQVARAKVLKRVNMGT